MAQHGYLREYDEGWDRGDDDRDDRRERGGGNWRSSWDEGSNRDRGDRGMMFGGSDRDRSWGSGDRSRDDDRGFFDRMGERASEWFGGDDDRSDRQGSMRSDRSAWEGNRDWPQRRREMSHYGREHGFGGFQGDYSRSGSQQGGFGGSGERQGSGSRFGGSSQDDHYRSWRDRQMQSLDRDYQDYCREREQQFHSDFDSWRRNRQQGQGQGNMQGGSQDQGALNLSSAHRVDPSSGMSTDAPQEPQATVDVDSAATLGQGNEKTGRRR